MNLDDLTIGEAKRLAAMFPPTATAVKASDDDLRGLVRIVVLQRGWVAVGRFYQLGDACRLENSFVIRRWGTTKGLGELWNGPLENTILDPAGVLRFHQLTIVCQFDCNQIGVVENGWTKICN